VRSLPNHLISTSAIPQSGSYGNSDLAAKKSLRNQYLAVRATDSADPYDRAQAGDYMSQLTWRALKASVSVCLSRVNFPAKAHRHHPVC
jgi:hypothetical protein